MSGKRKYGKNCNEILLALMQGTTAAEVCRAIGVSEATFGEHLYLQESPITCWGCEPGTWCYRAICEQIATYFQRTVDMVFPLDMYCFTAEKVLEEAHGAVEMVSLDDIPDIPSDRPDTLDILIDREAWDRFFLKVFDRLNPRERQVIILRFGLQGYSEHTVEEAAGMLGVTRERIRPIYYRALRKLHPLRYRMLDDLLAECYTKVCPHGEKYAHTNLCQRCEMQSRREKETDELARYGQAHFYLAKCSCESEVVGSHSKSTYRIQSSKGVWISDPAPTEIDAWWDAKLKLMDKERVPAQTVPAGPAMFTPEQPAPGQPAFLLGFSCVASELPETSERIIS